MLDQSKADVGGKAAGNAKKREKFVTLAESRTKTAIAAIRVIGKLGNRSAYEFDEADVRKITTALQREIEQMKLKMLAVGTKSEVDFKL